MQFVIEEAVPLSNYMLLVRFYSEEYEYGIAPEASYYVYDVKPLFQSDPAFRPLAEDPQRFASFRILQNGRAVSWGDDATILAEELALNSDPVDRSLLRISPDVFLEVRSFLKARQEQEKKSEASSCGDGSGSSRDAEEELGLNEEDRENQDDRDDRKVINWSVLDD